MSNGISLPIHPTITGASTSMHIEWPPGIEPTAHWMPAASSFTAAAWWLDTHPNDFAYAVAAASVAAEHAHLIFDGQCPVWLRPHPNPPTDVVTAILRKIALQMAAQHPANDWHTLHRWAHEAYEFRQRLDVRQDHWHSS